jgi:membrane protein implicated in regulation of membrane protease activity
MIEVADVVRIILGVLALLLGIACGIAAVFAPTWDQRGRFGIIIGYASIIVGGQLDTLGTPPTWRTWALAVVTASAVFLTGTFLYRHVRAPKGGPRDGRSADDQRGLLRARAAARRARDARDREGPPGGGPTT